MAKAARLHYMEDMNYKQIANKLEVSHGTVKKYFSDNEIKSLKRHFSDKQLFRLQRKLEQQIKDAEDIAHECVSNAKNLSESARAYNKTAKTAMSIPEKKIKLLQELGVIQKPKERKEVEQTSGDITFNEEIVTKKSNEEEKTDEQD